MDAERTPEQERARQMRMRARKLRALGKPLKVLPHEFEQVKALVRRAHEAGMTARQIGEQVGLDRTSPQQIVNGKVKTVRRSTYDKLMTLRIEEPAGGGKTRHHGSLTDPTGMQRRLRALRAVGFTSRAMAPLLDMEPTYIRFLTNTDIKYTYWATATLVAKVYEKLQDADPADYGIGVEHIIKARRTGEKRQWAPPWCWDDDTIDDPDAFPEWTGVCGTEEGAAVHEREGIPLCEPCRSAAPARQLSENVPVEDFDRIVFRATYKEQGYTARSLAEAIGSSPDSIYRWQSGERQPRKPALNKIADVLGVRPEELCADDVHDQ